MRIVEEPTPVLQKVLMIEKATYIGDFSIRIYFSDNKNRLVHFKPFLQSSFHPEIKKYLDEELFMQFEILDGNLNWNDYDLIFPISDLYKGKIK